MEKRKKAIIIGSVAVVAVSSLLLWSSQPHSYEDCILKNIDKANGQLASSMVNKACRDKFPIKFQDGYISFEEAQGKK